ncbi:hypothetical protein FE257_002461 [Aspergillus nanangensis]|uniref:Uncharacterized protein n=1 Tax=Aspergillus nanangensis TaxID=2582783 RepID=A0AAD4CST0_ASPNN|nr:hypothetical protein FE257_002461 [Aspergillus nanangensis]
MVKDKDTVIHEFNDLVTMTPNELRDWLKQEQSQSSGWSNNDSGETIGHERHVIYTDHDVDHMRRVVAYCKRHLAQEEKAKQDPSSKSYKSLKNWGHDPLKAE